MRLCLSVLVAVILTAAPASAVEECDDYQLKAIVGLDTSTYNLKFTLQNTGGEDICVLVWETLMDPSYWPIAVTLEVKDGNRWKVQTYDSPVLPVRLGIDTSDYLPIKKDSQVEFPRDLSDYFSFIKDSKYRVTVNTLIGDCYKSDDPGECNTANGEADAAEPEVVNDAVSSNPFTAEETKAGDKETIEQWLKEHDDIPHEIDGTVVSIGATESQRRVIKAAHTKAWQYFAKAIELLGDVPDEVEDGGDGLETYMRWFGKYSKDNYNKVLAIFQACLGEKDEIHIYVASPAVLCEYDDAADVLELLSGKKQHFINVCPDFFRVEETQVLSLTHEMTHDTARTQDIEHGELDCNDEDDCQVLATIQPLLAIQNAENYARFAEDAYGL